MENHHDSKFKAKNRISPKHLHNKREEKKQAPVFKTEGGHHHHHQKVEQNAIGSQESESLLVLEEDIFTEFIPYYGRVPLGKLSPS